MARGHEAFQERENVRAYGKRHAGMPMFAAFTEGGVIMHRQMEVSLAIPSAPTIVAQNADGSVIPMAGYHYPLAP